MTLAEFRRLTAHLDGERELLCAGAEVGVIWTDDNTVSVDEEHFWVERECPDATVLYRTPDRFERRLPAATC